MDAYAAESRPDELSATGAVPAEPALLVERSPGELRLFDFIAPRYWLLALLPIALNSVLSYISEIHVGQRVFAIYGGDRYEDVFFTSPNIDFIGRHLLPFGIPMTVPVGFGQAVEVQFLQTNLILGLFGLLTALLIIIAFTRSSNAAVYVAGPYAILSMLCFAWLAAHGPYYNSAGAIVPGLFNALIVPILAGLTAKIIAVAMRNSGSLEIDQDYAVTTEDSATGLSVAPPEAAAGSDDEPGAVEFDRRPLSEAMVCPYCGNPKLSARLGVCASCHHNLQLAFEHVSELCPSCEGALVRDAAFCHHCGKWLKATDDDTESAGFEAEPEPLAHSA